MSYRYVESGNGGCDFLAVTAKGRKAGLPRGMVILMGELHADITRRNYRAFFEGINLKNLNTYSIITWLAKAPEHGFHLYTAKHCDDPRIMTHIRKQNPLTTFGVNRFGVFISEDEIPEKCLDDQGDFDITENGWFVRSNEVDVETALKKFFGPSAAFLDETQEPAAPKAKDKSQDPIVQYFVSVYYSFDPENPLYVFDTEAEAIEFVKNEYKHELKVEREELGMGYDDADDEYGLFPKISEDGTFARIEQYKNGEQAFIEWNVTTLNNPQKRNQPKEKRLKVSLSDGILVAQKSPDTEYPGMEIEYYANDESSGFPTARILAEQKPNGEKNFYIWGDHNEDPILKVKF